MLLMAMLLAGAAPDCAPATVQAALQTAAEALQRRDAAAAKTAIAPVAACPVNSGPSYGARVLAADLASREGDWARVRVLLADLGLHPELGLGARAQFLLMRADQGMGDAAAFATDRALTLVANDARLTAAGRKLETFRVPGGDVTAYRTPVTQGAFARVLEFVATPDDKTAYPVTITLTDDTSAAAMMKTLDKAGGNDGHAWFIDLYRCDIHQSLPPVGNPGGAEPDYAAVKARVVETLTPANAFAGAVPENHACASANWLMPGFGLRAPPPTPR